MTAPLLVELFTEELPPKALKRLGEAFAAGLLEGLRAKGLALPAASVETFATPRRLGARISSVLESAPDRAESKKLMPSQVAFGADGKPSAALLKRLDKEKATADQLHRKTEGGAEYVFLDQTLAGVSLIAGLQSVLADTIAKLPVPKLMSYQLADGETTVQFVRPAHGLIALHGENVVDVMALGLKAGCIAHGHRFQGVKDFPIADAQVYEDALYTHGRVIASFELRRKETERQLRKRAAELEMSLGPDEAVETLLDEVTGLIEHPTVYVGEFEPVFLSVPPECLILTMRANQKYFPLFDASGKLTNRFLIVSNMRLTDPAQIIEGNQRVVRPRLSDARFFFETDKKTRLADLVPKLAHVTYQQKLGSQLDRMERVRVLAKSIAAKIGANEALADRAAFLAKADLVTNMVGEFPELQGVMGRYYALHDGEAELVAQAIQSHYRPRFAGDRLPESGVASAVALADKLETLAGMFGIGQQPTGEKDPFGLRRQALGVIRILIEGNLDLSLIELVNQAFAVFPAGMLGHAHADLETFIFERLRGYLRDSGYNANEVESVLCMRPALLHQIPFQLEAVRAFGKLAEAESLASANKRVANILRQAEAKGETFSHADGKVLREPAERDLFDALELASKHATPLFKAGDYTGYLKAFAVLKTPVDAFFDSVMVMVNEPDLRKNRLALLTDLRREMNRVADISKLAVEK